MGVKITDYPVSVSVLADEDLFDVSKLISTGPNVWESEKLEFSVLKAYITNSANLTSGVIPYWNGTNLVDSWLSRESAGMILASGKQVRSSVSGKSMYNFGAGGDEFNYATDGATAAEGGFNITPTNTYLYADNYNSSLSLSSANTALAYGSEGFELFAAKAELHHSVFAEIDSPEIWLHNTADASVGQYYASVNEAGIYTTNNSIVATETAVSGTTNYMQVRNAKAEIKHNTRVDLASPIVNFNNLTASTVVYLNSSKDLVSLPAGTNGHVLTLVGGLPAWAASASGTGDLKADGTVPMTADWDFGGFAITGLTSATLSTSLVASYATASTIGIFNGSKELISADTATYPNLTELSYLKGVTSSVQSQLNGSTRQIGEWYSDSSSINPLDNTVYYFSTVNNNAPETANTFRIISPKNNAIFSVTVNGFVRTTLATTETTVVKLQNITAATEETLQALTHDKRVNTSHTKTTLANSIGDEITVQWTNPAWATNPTGVHYQVIIKAY